MNYIEELRKIGVESIFIGPPPSTVLRLIVKFGEESEVHVASEKEFINFSEYFEMIRNGKEPIPEEFKVTFEKRESVTKVPSIVNGIYQLDYLETMILDQYINPFEYATPKDVWEAILESAFDLKGKMCAFYLKTAFLYLSEMRIDIKNDITLRREVEDRLKIDGVSLQTDENVIAPGASILSIVKQELTMNYSGIDSDTFQTEINDLKIKIENGDKNILSNLSDIQQKIVDVSNQLSAKNDSEKNDILLKLDQIRGNINDVSKSEIPLIEQKIHDLSKQLDSKDSDEKNSRLEELKQLKTIVNKVTEAGLTAILGLKEIERARLMVMVYLRTSHGNIKISVNNLHHLPEKIKQQARNYLLMQYGNSLQGGNICRNVFRKSKTNKENGMEPVSYSEKGEKE